MTVQSVQGDARVTELRRSFDEAFTRPPADRATDTEDLLLLRIGSDRYALRARDIVGVAQSSGIVALPSPVSELLGLAPMRGRLTPVYALAGLLGYPQDAGAVRWLVECGDEQERVALGFEHFEQYARVARGDISRDEGHTGPEQLREIVRTGSGTWAMVEVRSIVALIKRKSNGAREGARGDGA